MRKTFILVLLIVAVILITFSFLANYEKSAKEIMIKGLKQGEEVTSYSFISKFVINFDLEMADLQELDKEINTFPVITLFDSSTTLEEKLPIFKKSPTYQFVITGQEDKLSKELMANIKTTSYIGNIEFPLDFSIVQKESNLYLKIPEPALKLYPNLTKEYLYIETDYPEKDEVYNQGLLGLLEIIDESYFIKGNKEQFQLEDSEEIVIINISQEDIYNIDKETIQLLLAELFNSYSFTDNMDFPLDKLKLKNLSITNIYDQSGYQSQSIIDLSIDYQTEEYGLITINFNLEQEIYDINQKIEFEPLPDSLNVINGYNELSEMF